MTFWIAASLLTAFCLVLLLRTYARPEGGAELSAADVYAAQLKELERESADGLIAESELESARVEISRRQSQAVPASAAASASAPSRLEAGAIAFFLVAGTLGLYLLLGRPDLPAQPFAARDLNAEAQEQISPFTDQIEADLAAIEDPADRALYLASIFLSLEAWRDAIASYENALSHRPGDVDALVGIGEVLIMASDGIVPDEAVAWVDRALAADPYQPRAVFYRALYEMQQNKHDAAIGRLDTLLERSDENAVWRPRIQNLRDRVVESQAAVSAADEILSLPDGDREAAIRSMVEGLDTRLADNPGDFEGWLLLANARAVLGEPDAARAALEHAARLAGSEPQLLARVTEIRDRHGLGD